MNSRMKFLTLFLIPLVFIISLNIFGIRIITEVKGNVEQAIWVSCVFLAYYIIFIFWGYRLAVSPSLIIIITIFSLLFLPIRQNIAVVNYVQTETNIYWLERSYFTGTLKVFGAPDRIFLKPQQLYLKTTITHDAYLELDAQGQPILVYSKSLSDSEYARQKLTAKPVTPQ